MSTWWRRLFLGAGVFLAIFGFAAGITHAGILGAIPAAVIVFAIWRVVAVFMWRNYEFEQAVNNEVLRLALQDTSPALRNALLGIPFLGTAISKMESESDRAGDPSPRVRSEAQFRNKYAWLWPALGIPGSLVVLLVVANVLPSVFLPGVVGTMVTVWLGVRFLGNHEQ
jgi:hypothetical protein